MTVANINPAYKDHTIKAGKTIRSIHPPEANLSVKIDKKEIIVTPYRKDKSFEAIIEQNNFTNLTLQLISNQLTRIEQGSNNDQTNTTKIYDTNEVLFKSRPAQNLEMNIDKPGANSKNVEWNNKKADVLNIKETKFAPIIEDKVSRDISEPESDNNSEE